MIGTLKVFIKINGHILRVVLVLVLVLWFCGSNLHHVQPGAVQEVGLSSITRGTLTLFMSLVLVHSSVPATIICSVRCSFQTRPTPTHINPLLFSSDLSRRVCRLGCFPVSPLPHLSFTFTVKMKLRCGRLTDGPAFYTEAGLSLDYCSQVSLQKMMFVQL